jgi:hypothetical protein
MESQIAWGFFGFCFCSHFLYTRTSIQNLVFFGKLQKFYSNSTLKNFILASWGGTWQKQSFGQKVTPGHCQPCCSRWRGWGLRISAYVVYPNRKAFVWHYTGLITSGSLKGLREILPGMLLYSLGNKAGRTWMKVSPSYFKCQMKTFQLNCASGTWTGTVHSHGNSQHNRIRGVHYS